MTDFSTLTKLRLKQENDDKFLDMLDGSSEQSFSLDNKRKKNKRFIVIDRDGEFADDYTNIKAKLNLIEDDLHLINKKYFRKEFINENWDIIFENWSKCHVEDTDEELEYLMELETYVAKEDWNIESLDDFNNYRSFLINNKYINFPDITSFKNYENAFTYKKVPALIFEVEFTLNIPARYFTNFKHSVKSKGDTTIYSAMFDFDNVDEHTDKDMPYFEIHEEELNNYKKEYINEKQNNDRFALFLFG